MSSRLPETILQFGTGKFLRAFADLFVDDVNRDGRAIGRVVVVQSTGSRRAEMFNAQGGRYHVAIRGLRGGDQIDRTVEVKSVSRALVAGDDWDQVLAVAKSESLATIISNTTEAGYDLDPEDRPTGPAPRSFPGKLLLLLKARFEAGLSGLTILPCELVDGNADRLLRTVLKQAADWKLCDDLTDWIQRECSWHNTLVDRIVSTPAPGDPLLITDPLFAVAEPFALWLIEGEPPIPELLAHPAVSRVDRLEPYHLRKVRILNGAHTALVAKALPLGFQTVRQAVEDEQIGSWLKTLLFDEIVPSLEGRTENPKQFAEQVLERFSNPFLEHRLADIALHHDVKLQTRLMPTYNDFRQRFGRVPRLLDEILSSAQS